MTGTAALSRSDLETLAIERYFTAVDAKALDATLDCFAETAVFTVGTAGARFVGKAEIARMLTDYFASFDSIVHRDFRVTVDIARQRIAARFDGVVRNGDSETHLVNVNVWHVSDGRFVQVNVYMSGENVLR